MMKRLQLPHALLAAFTFFTFSIHAQSPTAPALGFNVFLQNGANFVNNETEGPVAIGGNLTLGGSYQVSTNYTGTYAVNGVKVTLLVGGKVNYTAGNSLQVNQNGYVKIGDSTGSYVWYKDNNNAYSPIRITPGANYNATPKISLAANSQNLGVSATNNPVFQRNLLDFATAFSAMKFKSTSMSLCSDNTLLTNANGVPLLLHTGLPSQVKVTLATGINYLNLTAADMNAIQNFTYNTQPSATRILIVNVNAPGTFNWSVWNSGGIGGSNTPYILYNFYNTTTLNIQGNGAVEGTVFAPYADITKTANQANIEGQVIAQSYYQNGGENHYFPFTTSISGCATAPVASFNINATPQCISGNSFIFTNASTGGSGLTYKWTFGDGGTSVAESPSKTYATAGTYAVKLVVMGAGGSDSTTKTVTVSSGIPTAGFSINDSSQYQPGNLFSFTTSGSTAGNSYKWSLGDGTTSSDINPFKSYPAIGTYIVKQVVTSGGGCKDSISKTVEVKSVFATSALFNVNSSSQCVSGNSFKFASASLGSMLSLKWYFGDGETSESSSPTKTYISPGTYTVKLVATGLGGKDSISANITVNPQPATGFSVNDSSQFLPGNSFVFTPAGSISGNTYSWNFGDATTSASANSSKSYSSVGNYTIKQVVTSTAGCKDSSARVVTVKNPAPTIASFTMDNPVQCAGTNSFHFTGTATGSGTLSYAWTFGDTTSSALANPVKTYSGPGTYNVKLVVTGLGGKDSIMQTVTVGALPSTGFSVNDSSQYLVVNRFVFSPAGSSAGKGYKWLFGDGSFSNDTTATKTYLAAGTYTVKQVVTSGQGCRDTAAKTVIVNLPLVTSALFNINNSAQCITGNSFLFTSVSVGTLLSVRWSFGDGSTSDLNNPVKTYTTPGTYTVKLVVSGLGGKDSITAQVTVYPLPQTGFTPSDTAQFISGNSFTFATTGSTFGNAYQWSFGDGTFSAAANPVKSYAAIGTYEVSQVVTSANGCKDSSIKTIVVKSPSLTVASFITDAEETQCLSSNSFRFKALATGSGTLTYSWSFGDGDISALVNPVKTYAATGTYTVKLLVTGAGGTDSVTRSVTVAGAPTAGFTVNDSSQFVVGNSFAFSTSGSTTGNIYKWEFGDGFISFDINPLKIFLLAGTYTVKQQVTSLAGCTDTFSREVTVKPVDPTLASFTINNATQCLTGNAFALASTSLGTGLLTALWDFGDGTISALLNPVKTYSAPGTYAVKLLINALGGKDSVTQTVTVLPLPLTRFTINDTAQFAIGNSFAYTPSGSTAGNTYFWDFGDGTNATGAAPVKTYSTAGDYLVKQVVTSNAGCMDSTALTVHVKAVIPTAALFTASNATQCITGNAFSFLNTSLGSGVLTYFWDFGDGTTSSLLNPLKSYAAPGTYLVKLKVTGLGGVDSLSLTVTVNPLPATGFQVNTRTQFLTGNSFLFTLTDGAGANTYRWDFGDSTFATDTNAVKSFSVPGTYTITQIVSSPFGCRDSILDSVIVNPVLATAASFTTGDALQCLGGNSFNFSGTSSGTGALTYFWDFGDGTISSVLNPVKIYTAAGIYTVKLITEGLGGRDSITHTVTVNAAAAGFSVNDTTQIVLDNHFAFTTDSLSGYSYFWRFGDGTAASVANPVKSYATAGAYVVKQIATSPEGCKDSLSLTVIVNPVLTTAADFDPDVTAKCLGNAFTFFNASIGTGTLSYSWDFGDGTTANTLSPSKIYATPGSYTVKLTVSGIGGLDSLSKTVTVITNAVKGFTVNDSVQALTGNSFSFNTTNAVAGNTYKWSFGDNSVSTDTNPLKTYFTPGSYTVNQVVTAANGCSDSISHTVIVESDSVGSGNGGGLESKSLGGAVTRRDYIRQRDNIDTRIDYKHLPVFVQASGHGQFNKAGTLKLSEMIPQHLDPNDVPRLSTPQDLVNLTIALEVLSVDYTINNQAKAAVLGIKTSGTAYNHTKPVCDRLRGATLVSVDTIRIQQYVFTRFALKQEDNTVEYGISFVAGTKAGRNNYSLQAHWLVSQYIDDDTMYTFQVWSTQPSYTTKLVNDILNNLKGSMPLNQLDQPTLPKAFVTHGQRQKENLILTIQNTTEDTYGKIVFHQRLNEQSGTDVVEVQLVLARFEKKEFSIPVKDGYEYDGMIYLENLPEDAIYMADGNWGLDFDSNITNVSEYIVSNDPARVYADNAYAVYRNVSVKCNTNDYLTVYKAISQGNARTDLTAYNNLTFFAKGKGTVSVRLTKDAIVNWNNQYTTNITLDTAGKVYNIRFSDLHAASQSGAFVPNDVKLLGFTFVVTGTAKQDINFSVKDVSFNTVATGLKETFTLEPMGVYPNPNAGSFSVSFATEENENLELVVTDLLGKTVLTKKVTALQGNNITRIDLDAAQSGYYLVNLKGSGKPYRAVKILVY